MRRDAVRMLLLVGLILLTGCATTPPARLCPVAYGSHGPLNKSFGLHHRFVVWGIDRFVGPVSPAVMSAVMETLQRVGHTVIEDARFEEVYNEHVRQHTYGFDDATVVRVGKLVGADSILFVVTERGDRKSTRLNSSHSSISYAVFCLKKKKKKKIEIMRQIK